MIRKTHLLCAAIVCLAAGAAFATDAFEVVMRAQDSDRRVSYRGIKSAMVCRCDKVTTAILKVVHLKPDKTRTEYFSPAALAGTVVVQDGAQLWRYTPVERSWEPVICPCPQSQNAVSKDVLQNYEVRIIGSDQIAGRNTYVVFAEPKRGGEAARRMWIDREHYVVIATQAEKPSGQVLSKSRYTSIEFNPDDISPSTFAISGKIKETIKPIPYTRFRALKPAYVPQGYRLIGTGSIMIRRAACSFMHFSNGANTISVFQRKADTPRIEHNLDGRLVNMFTRTRKGMKITLVGCVPQSELKKMAESVR